MGVISMKQLLEAGVHFGHQTRRWNPKMAEYIFAERNGIYIIDLQKTVKKVDEAYAAICNCIAEGGEILPLRRGLILSSRLDVCYYLSMVILRQSASTGASGPLARRLPVASIM